MPSEAFLREPVVVGRLRRIADEVAEFANAKAAASGLPGHVNGPRDAYRHLVGVGELSRRIGVIPASILAEYNEQISRRAMLRSERLGHPVAPANTRQSRAMDRHNNRLAAGLGMTARSPEEVIQRARTAIERAHALHGGSGANATAFWHPRTMWTGAEGVPWPASPPAWPAVESDHLRQYQGRMNPAPRSESRSSTVGNTFVDAHLRGGPLAEFPRQVMQSVARRPRIVTTCRRTLDASGLCDCQAPS